MWYIIYMNEEEEMYTHCIDVFNGDTKRVNLNASLLYIWRKENDLWQPPTIKNGPQQDTIPLLSQSLEVDLENTHQNINV